MGRCVFRNALDLEDLFEGGDLRSADRGTSGAPYAKLGQANGLNALLGSGVDRRESNPRIQLGKLFPWPNG